MSNIREAVKVYDTSYDVVGKKGPKRMDHSFYSKNNPPTTL